MYFFLNRECQTVSIDVLKKCVILFKRKQSRQPRDLHTSTRGKTKPFRLKHFLNNNSNLKYLNT